MRTDLPERLRAHGVVVVRHAIAVDFSRKLARRILPRGGPVLELATLADAAELIAGLDAFRTFSPAWDQLASLVLKAAASGEKADINAVTRMLELALRTEKWLR
jgi:hypothetical protein